MGSTTILVTLFTGFLIGMGSGVNVVTARYLGAGQHREVSRTVHTSVILLLITGLLLLGFGTEKLRPQHWGQRQAVAFVIDSPFNNSSGLFGFSPGWPG